MVEPYRCLLCRLRNVMHTEDQMFPKRESEMLQHHITEHGKMPKVNQEMEDLF